MALSRIFEHVHLTKAIRLPRLHLLRSMKFTMDRKSLQTIYFSFIRPLLEYADVVWDNCTLQQIKELEKKREGSFQEPQNWLQLINFIEN